MPVTVLLDDVVEVLDLASRDWHRHGAVDLVDGGLVGAAFVHRDLFRRTIFAHGLFEQLLGGGHDTMCRQKEIDGFAFLVDGTVEVLPDPLDLDVSLVHSPAAANLALVFE